MLVRAAATANQRSHKMSLTEYAANMRTFEKCTKSSAGIALIGTSANPDKLTQSNPQRRQFQKQRVPKAGSSCLFLILCVRREHPNNCIARPWGLPQNCPPRMSLSV